MASGPDGAGLVFAVCVLLNLAGEWWDRSAIWQLAITMVALVCAMIMDEAPARTDSHVTLHLQR